MHSIDNIGVCSYASTVGIIINYFKNKPILFKEKFGYDLITDDYGIKSINGAELLLDLFVWANTEANGGVIFRDNHTINRDILKKAKYLDSKQVYFSNSSGFNADLLNKFLASKGINLKVNSQVCYGKRKDSGKIVSRIVDHLSMGLPIEMGVGNGSTIYSYYNRMYKCKIGGGHSIFITGICDEGFICATWGSKGIVPFKEFFRYIKYGYWNDVSLIYFNSIFD